jgi:hypothetical protein
MAHRLKVILVISGKAELSRRFVSRANGWRRPEWFQNLTLRLKTRLRVYSLSARFLQEKCHVSRR